jgi:hypothetical protein
VWDAHFTGVWHLAEDAGGPRLDSTTHANDGMPAGFDGDEAAAGPADGANYLDGVDDIIALPEAATSGLGAFTLAFWIRTTEDRFHPTFWHNPTLAGMVTTGYRSGDFALISSHGFIGLWSGLCAGDDATFLSPTVAIDDGTWHFVCAVDDGAQISLFVDDAYAGQVCAGGRPVAALPFWLGGHDGQAAGESGDFHSGAFDELRLSDVARPAGYRNQRDPARFVTEGAEQDLPP